jgi:hypothetical protein
LNPIDSSSGHTLTNGNLDIIASTTAWKNTRTTISIPTSGKWYAEFTIASVTNGENIMVGFSPPTLSLATYLGAGVNSIGFQGNGNIWTNGSSAAGGTTFAANDVIQIAVDRASGKAWLGKNGTWVSSGNPAAGTNQTTSSVSTTGELFFGVSIYTAGNGVNCNFGQRAFAYTAPSGFKALVTTNLPTPTIGATSTTQANDYFNILLYTGNGSAGNAKTGLGFQPDFLWFKSRNQARSHALFDAVRTRTYGLASESTNGDYTSAAGRDLASFDSDGFTVGVPENFNSTNANGDTIVTWAWNAGGSTVTNTSGTISAQVRANTTSGFSIVTYTGNGSSSQTFGHGLGVAPSMVIIKSRNNADNWRVFHSSVSGGNTLTLNFTAAAAAPGFWPSNPSSTVVSIGTDSSVNSNTWTYVAYCFAPVAGYSAFGSYTGNGSADGPFVCLGFRPKWFMVKASGLDESWYIYDSLRNTYNVVDLELNPNNAGAEAAFTTLDFLSNGVKIRTTNSAFNTSSATYIYAAFAETPAKFSLAR